MGFKTILNILIIGNIILVTKLFAYDVSYARVKKFVQPCRREYLTYYWDVYNRKAKYKLYKTIAIINGKVTEPDNVAECRDDGINPIIIVNAKVFNKKSKLQRYSIMMHELAHCIHKKPHNEEMENGCPKSLMYPYTISDKCLKDNWLTYTDNLFWGE